MRKLTEPVVLRGLTKVYPGGVRAVDGIDLTVQPGELFALVGPSGCGKTTTLRLIAGLERPTAGEVFFGTRPMSGVPPQAREIGLVFQHYALFPTMTVYENVAYGLRVRKLPDREVRARVEHYLEAVGLTGLEARRPEQLSAGQQQRVALARALAIEPRLLLLDEPLSNLDVQLRRRIRREIRRLQRNLGLTAIYVTHDQEEALSMADHVGVMNRGVLEQVGPPETVYSRPASPFVATFIGDGSLLDGEFVPAAGGGEVAVGPLRIPVPVAAHLRPGPAWVCVRPEALRLVVRADDERDYGPDEEIGGGPGGEGIVDDVEFLGASVRGELRVPGVERPLVFSQPALEAGFLAVGRRVRFTFDRRGVWAGSGSSGNIWKMAGNMAPGLE